jgi:hypothetical protein
MKTPIQELIEKLKEERSKLQALNERVMVLTLDYAIADAEQMLEKEKEVMSQVYADGGDWDEVPQPRFENYYNETFNTKEK